MNHQHKGRKFGRKRGERKAFLKGIASNLIMRERIETTIARAKEIRPLVERLVSIAKGQKISDLRRLLAKVDKISASKLYYQLAPRYEKRTGGYLRIIKTTVTRKRDAAPVALIEFV